MVNVLLNLALGVSEHETNLNLAEIIPSNQWEYFELGAKLVISRWTALRMAVEGQWGGGDVTRKFEILLEEILHMFKYNKNIYVDDLASNIEEFIESEFNLVCEDGSVDEISKVLVMLAEECKKGEFQRVQAMKESVQSEQLVDIDLKKAKVEATGGEGMVGVVTQEPQQEQQPRDEENLVDEDGFTTVRRSTRKKKQIRHYDPDVQFPGAQ